jgi:hypothetical protein
VITGAPTIGLYFVLRWQPRRARQAMDSDVL